MCLNDYEKAHFYLNSAAKLADSIAKKNLAKKIDAIEAKYNLTKEKQKTLEEKNKHLNTQSFLYLTILIISLLITIGAFLYRRQKKYKKRFEDLMVKLEEQRSRKKLNKNGSGPDGVPIDVSRGILKELKVFEMNNAFINQSLSLNNLAKDLKTNSTYLSKVINFYKKTNYTTYINDLRIQYAIDKLNSEKKFRNYTIKAIAFETGFKSSEYFSKAFYKKTEMYPSFFIKQLQKIK